MSATTTQNRAILLGNPATPLGGRIKERLGLSVEKEPAVGAIRGAVVHLIGDSSLLKRETLRCRLLGARGVLASPLGGPWGPGRLDFGAQMPWWSRLVFRVVLESQEEARRWMAAGMPAGKLVVILPGEEESFLGVYREVGRMG